MKMTLSTIAIEILIIQHNPLSFHTHQIWWENFFWCLYQPVSSSSQCYSGSMFFPLRLLSIFLGSSFHQITTLFSCWFLQRAAGAWTALHTCCYGHCVLTSLQLLLSWKRLPSIWATPPPLAFVSTSSANTIWPGAPLRNSFFHLTHGMPMNALHLGLLQLFSHFTRNDSLKCCIWSKWLTLRLGIHSWYL